MPEKPEPVLNLKPIMERIPMAKCPVCKRIAVQWLWNRQLEAWICQACYDHPENRPAPLLDQAIVQWACINCGAKGELETDYDAPLAAIVEEITDEHNQQISGGMKCAPTWRTMRIKELKPAAALSVEATQDGINRPAPNGQECPTGQDGIE